MGVMLRQHKYIIDILTRTGMTSCKPVDTPISTSKVTIMPDFLFSNPTRFRQIAGTFQYLTFTITDIYFIVNRVSQLYILLQILTGLPLNAFCVVFRVRHPMACISRTVPPLLYMALRM